MYRLDSHLLISISCYVYKPIALIILDHNYQSLTMMFILLMTQFKVSGV